MHAHRNDCHCERSEAIPVRAITHAIGAQPMRHAGWLMPWLERQARRAVLLVWWTLTLQLPKQFSFWLQARRMRRSVPVTPDLLPTLIESAEPSQIHIPHQPNPIVSIIIPSYGKVDYTLRCLASIAANPPEASIEVIVVDDATPDASTECLASVDGIRLIVNPQNLGSWTTVS